MYANSSHCSVNYQARALCPQHAAKDKHRFLIGTCSLHDSNELNVLEYFEDTNHFEISAQYPHPDQIWSVESCPYDSSLVLTSRQNSKGLKSLTLWKMERQEAIDLEEIYSGPAGLLELEEKCSFGQSQKPAYVEKFAWNKNNQNQNALLTIDNKVLTLWDIQNSKVSQSSALIVGFDGEEEAKLSDGSTDTSSSLIAPGCVTWDPHAAKLCCVGSGNSLRFVDTREMEVTAERKNAHVGNIRDIDYNPNKTNILISAGDDRKIKFWDTRKMDKPLIFLTGHSHWIRTAKYNPYHDQLILSGGSDAMVNLWRIASCSSAPWLGGGDGDNDPPNVKVKAMDQHEESIYGVAWSPADAWIYCSLSFDGRAIINHVPSTEKYKILL